MQAVSGVRSGRERAWLVTLAALSAMLLVNPGGLAGEVTGASAVLLAGTATLATQRRGTAFGNAALAVLLAFAAVVFWAVVFRIGWGEIEQALVRQWNDLTRQMLNGQLSRDVGALAEPVARLYPARMALSGLLGAVLAAEWHHRLAVHPIGPRPGRFTEFRVPVGVVWLTSAALALMLVSAPASASLRQTSGGAELVGMIVSGLGTLGLNLLVVVGGLYAACGLAVAGRILRPGFGTALLGAVLLFLLPFVLLGLAGIGLADTWIDFRRRLPAPPHGG